MANSVHIKPSQLTNSKQVSNSLGRGKRAQGLGLIATQEFSNNCLQLGVEVGGDFTGLSDSLEDVLMVGLEVLQEVLLELGDLGGVQHQLQF